MTAYRAAVARESYNLPGISFLCEVAVRYPWLVLSLTVMLLLAAPAGSQSKPAPQRDARRLAIEAAASPAPQFGRARQEEDRIRYEREREMARQRNKDRQAALKKDTDKLLELATQLKEYVDKTNENLLSVDVVKKAEEIEKLSKRVKDKMKGDEYYPTDSPFPGRRR